MGRGEVGMERRVRDKTLHIRDLHGKAPGEAGLGPFGGSGRAEPGAEKVTSGVDKRDGDCVGSSFADHTRVVRCAL